MSTLRAALLLAFALVLTSCAGARPPVTDAAAGAVVGRGYKALFRGESRRADGRTRFRMAVALLPPARLRLEFFGPVGGARLIVAADDTTATALLPHERAYDRAPATPETLGRLLGVPLDAEQLVALLTGRPLCRSDAVSQRIRTRAAATFGRTRAWYEVTCPPGEIRYEATCRERGGLLERATVREGISGAMILEVEYGDHVEGAGVRWPRRIRMNLVRRRATVQLTATEGPWARDVAEAIFTPPIPERFAKRPDLLSLTAPGLLGSIAERER